MRWNQMMLLLLEGCCSSGIPSYLTVQRYIKNVKKTNFLIKKTLANGKNIHRLGKNELNSKILYMK